MSQAASKSRLFKVRPSGENDAALATVDSLLSRERALVPAQGTSEPDDGLVTTNAAAGSVIEVPIEELIANPANARRLVSVSALDTLIETLQAHGQLTALLMFYDEKGRPTLIDGHRRVSGGKQLGWTHMRCEVRPRPESTVDLYLHSRIANAQHETQTPLDDAIVWRELLEKKVFESQAALARAVGVQEADVSRTLALTEIPKTLMLLLVERQHLLTLRMLTAIRGFAKQHGLEETEALLVDIDRSGLSARQVEKRLTAHTAAPVTRPRSDRHSFSWGGMSGELRRFDKDGRIELSIKRLDAAALQSLEELLLKALSPQGTLGN